jgi:4-hydroxybenzoyl-CoA thioesterase
MSFTTRAQVRFAHVDAAGIVFYPRFFEMLNAAVEDWCAEGLGCDFATLIKQRGLGTPTVHLETDFVGACDLGEWLEITLKVERLGESSVTLSFAFDKAGERRLGGKVVLVCMHLAARRAVPWPADLRVAMQSDLEEAG